MRKVTRRVALGSLGILGGTGLLAGCGNPVSGDLLAADRALEDSPAESSSSGEPAATARPQWTYHKLDPDAIADAAYELYPAGSCMYAVFGSVIHALAEKMGEPYRSFPIEMMRYGSGGLGGWGSLCGVVNGATALFGLFHHAEEKEQREKLIAELCTWYESTPLPQYTPAASKPVDANETSVAGSVLCHVSVDQWQRATGFGPFEAEKKQRCRRLAADGARKVVEILNRKFDDRCEFAGLEPDVQSCVDCHGRAGVGDASVKMRCSTCHQLPEKHW